MHEGTGRAFSQRTVNLGTRRYVSLTCGVTLAMLAIFSGSSALAQGTEPARLDGFTAAHSASQLQLEDRFQAEVSSARALDDLNFLAKLPGEDGTPGAVRRAKYLERELRKAGLDVAVQEFYPYMADTERVGIALDMVAPEHVALSVKEERQPWQQQFNQISPGFLEGSPAANITKSVVYVNFGSAADYDYLSSQGISVQDKVVLARYGGPQRSEVPYQAWLHGAAGVLLYSDPQQDGYTKGPVYPDGPWRAPDGIQRGTVYRWTLYPGDPLTPGTPATKDAPRIPVSESSMGKIPPSAAIGYGAAEVLLKNLSGPVAPNSWQGGLPIQYRIGPGGTQVHLAIDVEYAPRASYNVIGYVRGTEQPERLTVLGNHYDTWAYGAQDNQAGVSVELEIARSLGKLLQSGWKPKRTIALGFFSAEERGITGTTEWTEMLGTEKMADVVAYLNADVVSGAFFRASGVPSLDQLLYDTTKQVAWPGGGSVYDAWGFGGVPRVGRPGGGTDFMPFLNHFGAPVIVLGAGNPTGRYHCSCDDLYSLLTFIDPGLQFATAVGKEMGLIALRLNEADVLPFHYSKYATETVSYLNAFASSSQAASVDVQPAIQAAGQWGAAASDLEQTINTALQSAAGGGADFNGYNAAYMRTERTLLVPRGLPDRPWYQHQIYAPQFHNGFALQTLPGLYESLSLDNSAAEAQGYAAELAASLNQAAQTLHQ